MLFFPLKYSPIFFFPHKPAPNIPQHIIKNVGTFTSKNIYLFSNIKAKIDNIRPQAHHAHPIQTHNGKEKTVEKKETTRGLILVQDSKTRGAYGICKSKDTYILVEPFFGSNNEESLKFSVESDVVNLFVDFIKEM